MKIIFPQNNGEIAITFFESNEDLIEIGRRTTPNGIPFLIVQDSDLPADWFFSSAWVADFSNPSGFGIGPQRWFIEKAQNEIENGVEIEKNQMLIQQMKNEIFQLEGIQL